MSGSLIQSSAITNTSVITTDTSYLPPVTSNLIAPTTPTTGLACPASVSVAGISNAAMAITNNVIATAETVAAGLVETAVVSAVAAVANPILNAVANAENSVVGLLAADAAAIANNVASSVSNLFSNTISAIGTTVKIPIPDPIASSFANGVPQSSLFATNSILAQMDAVTLGALNAVASAASGVLSAINQVAALEAYGVATAAALENAILSQLAQLSIVGSYGALESLLDSTPLEPTASFDGGDCPDPSYADYADYATLCAPIATALTGSATGLASMYNPYLPTAATSTGAPISGVPSTVSASVVNQIVNALSNTLGVPGITVAPTPYAAIQSLFDGLYAISAQLGLVAVLEQMATASLFAPSTQAQARAVLAQTTTNPTLIATLFAAGQAENIHLPSNWYAALVTNPTLTAADAPSVETVLTLAAVTPADIFTTTVDNPTILVTTPLPQGGVVTQSNGGSSVPSQRLALTTTLSTWNTQVLAATTTPIASALLATSPLSAEGAASASLPTTGLPPAAMIGLMTRGTTRRLTPNLRFVPLTKSKRTVSYGSITSPL